MNGKNEQPIRILHVISGMNRGGAETLLMNLYRNIDRTRLQFDFAVYMQDKGHYDDEIKALGGCIFYCGSPLKDGIKGLGTFVGKLEKIILSHGPYWAVHSHTDYHGGLVMLAARQAGIKRRICHSHNTDWTLGDLPFAGTALFGLKQLIKLNSTRYCACGNEAGSFLFGSSAVNKGRVHFLKNAIDLKTYEKSCIPLNFKEPGHYNARDNELCRSLDIKEDQLIIGHVGRFFEQKNHSFIINICSALRDIGVDFKLLLAGDGPLRTQIEEMAAGCGIEDRTLFLGVREDIPALMALFDVFLFPSVYEGLGIVLIEAQACGTPCIISDTIPEEGDMGLGLIKRLSIEAPALEWAKEAASIGKKPQLKAESTQETTRLQTIHNTIRQKGYEINSSVEKLMGIYGLEVGVSS